MLIQELKNKILREGIVFKKILRFLEESQYYSKSEIQNYQDECLRAIISHAYKNVPYYKRVFDDKKLKPPDIKTQKDMWKVPVLTKQNIKENFKELKASNVSKLFLNLGHTSGTTGSPAHFYRDLYSINYENAIVWRQWGWAGITKGDKIAICRGVKLKGENTIFHQNKIQKQLLLSSFHLSNDNMKSYIDEMKKFQPTALQAYPSTAYTLAKYLEKINEKVNLKAVFTSSEPIYSFQRELIEDRFECKIWDFYGLAERVISASECEYHDGLHLNEEYGITEVLNNNNEPTNEGIFVGTTLHNYSMPLIRYITTDYGNVRGHKCSCGRNHRVIAPIETKQEDMIETKDGRYISPSIITHAFKPLTHVDKSQVIQHSIDNFEVKIVPEKGFNNNEIEILMKGLKERFGRESNIEINLVHDIPRTTNGKYRWVISKLNKGR